MKHASRIAILTCALLGSLLALATPAAAQATPTCAGREATIIGTPGNDRIIGTPGNDVIVGLGGKDKIFAGRGNDIICGGDGPDLIKGQGGRDKIYGGQGNDRLQGNNGKDTILGGGGRDSIIGARGDDIINGEGGNDIINGGDGNNICTLDRKDLFSGCNGGDVRGTLGTGAGGTNLNVPANWTVHTSRVGNTVRNHYVAELSFVGDQEFSSHIVRFFDADGELITTLSQSGQEWSGEFIIQKRPARMEVDSDGVWEAVIKAPKLIAREGRTFRSSGSRVYFLKSPIGANGQGAFSVGDDASGNVVLKTYAASRFADLRVNVIHPREDGINLYEGAERQGTYLVEVQVDEGSWELTFTG